MGPRFRGDDGGGSLNDPTVAQAFDLRRRESKLGQYLVGVLGEFGRATREAARRAAQAKRLARQGDLLAVGGGQALAQPQMLGLRIVERLIDRIDRPTWHLGL